MWLGIVVRRILQLLSCERVGREGSQQTKTLIVKSRGFTLAQSPRDQKRVLKCFFFLDCRETQAGFWGEVGNPHTNEGIPEIHVNLRINLIQPQIRLVG